MQTVTMTMVRE